MSKLEKLISGIVLSPGVNDLAEIKERAMEEKTRVFKEVGWETLNHPINAGDVSCVLIAILKLAEEKAEKEGTRTDA